MLLEEINIINYKNIKSLSVSLSPKVNCFIGENGSGKTNIVDAVYYTSMCKSLISTTDNQTINFGEDFFMIDALYQKNGGVSSDRVVCSYKRGGEKIIKRGEKRCEKLSDHIGVIPTILVSPYDSALINDAAEERRKFLNVLIAQVDRNYLHSLIRYNSLLADRNKLLKNPDGSLIMELLEIIDFQLCDCAAQIYAKRQEFISMLSPSVCENYEKISLGREEVALTYKSDLHDTDYSSLLIKNYDKDRALGYTYSGVHRDDLVIKIGDHAIKRFGSWGQQKSLLIALKLSEFDMIYERSGVKPILLLDDIFDKLDMSRVEALLSLVYDDKYGQIFITDSNKTRLLSILHNINKDYRLFSVEKGVVTSIDE